MSNPINGNAGVILLPSALILSFFLDAFATAESAISRDREFIADAAGAQLAGAACTGAALVKVHAFAKVWDQLDEVMLSLLAEGQQLTNVSTEFVAWAREMPAPAALAELDEQQVPHPTDSHPPLSQRLAALGLRLEDVQADALQTAPAESAIHLFNHVNELECELSNLEHQLRVQSGQVTVPVTTAPAGE